MPAAILGPVAGAVVGGMMSDGGGGGSQTASKEPWSEAAPWLRQNLQTGQALQQYYQQNPFNAMQQTGYQNLFSDLDNFRTNMAPGLMQFANNAMTGSYSRQPASRPGTVGYGQQGASGQPAASMSAATYFANNKDVADAYANRANDPNLASTVNMTPDQFAQLHFAKFGQKEQRQLVDPSTPGGLLGRGPFSVAAPQPQQLDRLLNFFRPGTQSQYTPQSYGLVNFMEANPFTGANGIPKTPPVDPKTVQQLIQEEMDRRAAAQAASDYPAYG